MTTQPITPLRQRMLDDMKLRNMATGTRRSYVRSVASEDLTAAPRRGLSARPHLRAQRA